MKTYYHFSLKDGRFVAKSWHYLNSSVGSTEIPPPEFKEGYECFWMGNKWEARENPPEPEIEESEEPEDEDDNE